MDFFQRQSSARRSSRQLILLLALAVVAIVIAVGGVVVLAIAVAGASEGGEWRWQHALPTFGVTAVLTVLLVLGASWYRIASLRKGGAEVARQLGGRRIGSDCRDPNDRRLRNIVEELAIAACLPVPAVFVLDDEPGINAFAAGLSPSDAAIAVTRGALDRLNRDELQGVIAHEFSHILNGDMALNLRLVGVLFGILAIGVAGRKVLEHGRGGRDSKGAAAFVMAALAIMAIGYVGVFFGRLIKASVSRSREVLADASAVQFTRQSAGLAGALKKIAGLGEGAEIRHPKAEEVSHMLFGEWRPYSSWFATHPPLVERIRALEPGFNDHRLAELAQRWHAHPPVGLDEDAALGLDAPAASLSSVVLPPPDAQLRPFPGTTAARIAQPVVDDTRRASGLHQVLPEALADAARQPLQAAALILAMLVDRDRAVQARQLAEVAVEMDEDIADAVGDLVPACLELHAALRLPLVALSFPALRQLPREQLESLVRCCDRLVHLDGRVGLFDYCLSRLLQRQVMEAIEPSRFKAIGKRKLVECERALADLFATVASYGHDDPDAMRRAYVAGLVSVLPQKRFEFAPPKHWIAALDNALAELDQLDASGKQLLVEALVLAVSHDGRITVDEAELIRTICACLHCPLPPVVEQRARPRG